MGNWQTILLTFGGNAVLIAILGYMGKLIFEKILARDALKLESKINSFYNIELENIKSNLAVRANEQSIKFLKLHERRAEVITKTYALLQELHLVLGEYVKIFEHAGDTPKEERRNIAGNALNKFTKFYRKNKIFLSKSAVIKIDDIVNNLRSYFYQFLYSVEMAQAAGRFEDEKWTDIFEKVNNALPIAISELEDEFRSLLGDSE
jgi:hypothetical protein